MTSELPLTPLAALAQRSAAPLAPYAGVQTVAHFGDPFAEFETLTTGCGVYDLGWRGKIAFSGSDRVRWMNGMVTNNIRDLKAGRGNYNFVLNAQGRIQGDLYIYDRGEYLLGDTERWQVAPLMGIFDRLIIMDDVAIADMSDEITSVGIQGPDATKFLHVVGIDPQCADPLVVCGLQWRGFDISATRMVSEEFLTYEIWLSPVAALELWPALVNAGAQPVGIQALEQFRIFMGVPKYGQDIRERDLPQETAQDHALNFTKGCYIGQEIVERIRSRGQVHRTLTGFQLGSNVEKNTKLMQQDKEVGELTSVQAIRRGGKEHVLALGYIRREALANQSPITADGVSATPAKLPFKL